MNRLVACPDTMRLQDLLDGMLPDGEQTELTHHLDGCAHCQHRLETLAVGDQPWPGVTRLERSHTSMGPALSRAIAELKKTPRGEGVTEAERPRPTASEPEADRDELLDFLQPSEQPGHLGRFGPYEVLEILGHGGMGIVLKALDPALNRLVAIKVLAPQLAASGAARKRFAREARAAAAVSHEHVVTIHAVDAAQGLPYLVMQYVPGLSLQQRLDRDGPLELEEILRIAMQTAQGLAAAHAQGVVHRDVKPGNILLEDGVERVKLTDFGLARVVDDATVTGSGCLPGTPAYMAPEQASGEGVDHRADLFSLGSVVYAMCTARPPFRASTLVGLLRRVSDSSPCPVQELNPRIPDWLVEIMNRLHVKEPARRFQSAAEVATVFADCLTHVQQPVHSPLPAFLRPYQRRRVPPRRGMGWLVAAVIALFLVGVAATVLRIKTADGTLVVEVSDPSVQVTVDGQDVIISGAGIAEVRLRAGEHRLLATKDGKAVLTKLVDIKRAGREVVKVTLEPTASGKVGVAPLNLGKPAVAPEPMTLKGHTGVVASVAFSPDGKLLATAGADGIARFWDASTGKSRADLKGHEGPIVAIAFFSDGRTLLTVGADGTLQLWDVASGKQMARLKLSASFKVSALAPDSKVLATADGAVKLWDVQTGKELSRLGGGVGEEDPKALAFSPDGRALASSGDGTVRVWDVASGKEVRLLLAQELIRSVAFSPDGRRLVGGGDEEVRVWDTATGKQMMTVRLQNAVSTMRVSPDGKLVATGSVGGTVSIIEAVTGKVLATFQGQGAVTCLAFSPDGRTLAWGTNDGTVKLWRTSTEKAEVERLREELNAARLEAEQNRAAAEDAARKEAEARRLAQERLNQELRADAEAAEARRLAQERLNQERLARQAEENARVQSAAERDRARKLLYLQELHKAQRAWEGNNRLDALKLLGQSPPALRNWEWHFLHRLAEGASNPILKGHTGDVRTVAFSPDARFVASGGEDTTVRVWEPDSGKEVRRMQGHGGTVHATAFSPDGRILATGGGDGDLILWDSATGKIRVRTNLGNVKVTAVAFTPDAKGVVVAGTKGTIRLLEAQTGKVLRDVTGYKGSGRDIAVSPDGRRLALAAGEDESIYLWDLSTGQMILSLGGHKGAAQGVTFSPDGNRLASASADGLVRIWDASTAKLLYTLKGHTGAVLAVRYNADGQRLVSGGQDATVRVWDTTTGLEVLVLRGHDEAVTSVACSPDGRRIISGSTDRTVRIWSAVPAPKP